MCNRRARYLFTLVLLLTQDNAHTPIGATVPACLTNSTVLHCTSTPLQIPIRSSIDLGPYRDRYR